MKTFELTILGSNSALPAYGRFPTSQVLNINEELILIDCGEGCQIRLTQYKIKRNRINNIFISHLHGDHVYGLPGVVTSFYHYNRNTPVHIYGPKGIRELLETVFRLSRVHPSFDLQITELEKNEPQEIFSNRNYNVTAFPVDHRVTTYGYLFRETAGERNIRKDLIEKYELTVDQILQVKKGEFIRVSGKELGPDDLCHPADPPRSYAYCADSRYNEYLIPVIKGADLLYFETTYLDELAGQADERGHATARQAAMLAKKAGVRKLVTGHYSSRYKALEAILQEARSVFPDTTLGYDGEIISL